MLWIGAIKKDFSKIAFLKVEKVLGSRGMYFFSFWLQLGNIIAIDSDTCYIVGACILV